MGGGHSLPFPSRTQHSSGALWLTVYSRVVQGNGSDAHSRQSCMGAGTGSAGVLVATRQETAMPRWRFEERPWCRDYGLYLLNHADITGVRFSYVHSPWGTTRAGVIV